MFTNKYGSNGQSIPSLKNYWNSANPEREKQGDKSYGYHDRTTNQLGYASPYKASDPLTDTKRSLHQAIEMLESKRLLNRQAIEQVRSVNQQIATSISTISPIKVSRYFYKDKTPNRDNTSKNITPRSQFQWHEEDTGKSQKETDLNYENLNIRARLNDELKKNNEMIRYVKHLETQNQTLRSSHVTNPNVSSLIQENRYLKKQLAASQNENQFLKKDLLDELQKLKAQNSQLRKDTIHLMRMKQGK